MSNWPDINYQSFRLIISDLDGTLKNMGQPLDPAFRDVILGLDERGVKFTIATGKNLNSTRETAQALGILLPVIFSNGCVIQGLEGEVFQKHVLPAEFVKTLTEVCDQEEMELALHIGEDIYVRELTHNTSILLAYGSPGLEVVGEWSNISHLFPSAYKCIAIDRNNRQRLFELEKIVHMYVGETVEYCHTLVEMLEFMPKEATKENGVAWMIKEIGVPMSSVMAIGDGNNDIGMLKEAGYGIAVASAPLAVKEASDWVIPSCSDHGPINFLNHFLNQIR